MVIVLKQICSHHNSRKISEYYRNIAINIRAILFKHLRQFLIDFILHFANVPYINSLNSVQYKEYSQNTYWILIYCYRKGGNFSRNGRFVIHAPFVWLASLGNGGVWPPDVRLTGSLGGGSFEIYCQGDVNVAELPASVYFYDDFYPRGKYSHGMGKCYFYICLETKNVKVVIKIIRCVVWRYSTYRNYGRIILLLVLMINFDRPLLQLQNYAYVIVIM